MNALSSSRVASLKFENGGGRQRSGTTLTTHSLFVFKIREYSPAYHTNDNISSHLASLLNMNPVATIHVAVVSRSMSPE